MCSRLVELDKDWSKSTDSGLMKALTNSLFILFLIVFALLFLRKTYSPLICPADFGLSADCNSVVIFLAHLDSYDSFIPLCTHFIKVAVFLCASSLVFPHRKLYIANPHVNIIYSPISEHMMVHQWNFYYWRSAFIFNPRLI